LRFAAPVTRLHGLAGKTIVSIRRRGKYLLFDLDSSEVMLVHLGMSGRLGVVGSGRELLKHDHVLWSIGGDLQMRFNDPRRFGFIDVFAAAQESAHPRLIALGVEPLGEDATPEYYRRRARGCTVSIKHFIMDAGRVVGIGNIYAAEALHTARINPKVAAGRLSLARWKQLNAAIRATLLGAIEQGGTTLRDFADADGRAGYFTIRLKVYGRAGEPCTRCENPIQKIVQSGRSTFYCTRCQSR
jgi:formamidopyrimidine-DNA glycosylase